MLAVVCGQGKKGEISIITFDENEIEVLAHVEHIRWMKVKKDTG